MQMCSCKEAVEVFLSFLVLDFPTLNTPFAYPEQADPPLSIHCSAAPLSLSMSVLANSKLEFTLYADSAFFSMLFIEGVRTCSIPSLSFAADCSLQRMLFICTAIDKIQWLQKKKWTCLCCPTSVGYTVSKTRKKAPFGVWRWRAVVFHTGHFGSIFMLVDSWWNKWWAA